MLVDSNDHTFRAQLLSFYESAFWGAGQPTTRALCGVCILRPLPTQHLNAESVPYQQSGPCPAGPGGRAPSKNSFRRLTPRNHALLPTPDSPPPRHNGNAQHFAAASDADQQRPWHQDRQGGISTLAPPHPTLSGPLLTLSSRQHYCGRSSASNAAHGVRCWAPGWHAALHRAGGVDVAVHPHRT